LIDVKVVVARGEAIGRAAGLWSPTTFPYFDITVLGALVPGEFVARGDLPRGRSSIHC